MGLDIRFPIGMMFTLLGALMGVYGLATASNPDMYKLSLGLNVNFWWGLVLFVFGSLMLVLALRGNRKRLKGVLIDPIDPAK